MKNFIIGLIIGVAGVLTVIYFINKNKSVDIQVVNLIKEKVVLQHQVDSLSKIINDKMAIVKLLEKQLSQQDSDIIKINQKYEKIYVNIGKLGIDDQIKLFSRFITKEDSIKSRYINSNQSTTIDDGQLYIY